MKPTLSQAEYDAMDDVARFGCDLHESDLDKAIEAKKRTYDVEIRHGGKTIGYELNVRAMCSMDVIGRMYDLHGEKALEYTFVVRAK